ncbi:YeeE/YedE thiosulfate transporter family protein [Acetonema longum]|uniref:Uncharacterized protein n=1 Tax=Acetonema longum DSM 6540 TaxID=1009370 RepID=F7NP36_9FIRM|nr:YeeE/YedE thiosulfate transporter family protein [Acetonema longum]EGO62159.1 hypothetical protein ALO_19387 [Acetonema longum DSM 6540]
MTAKAVQELETLKKAVIKDAWPYWLGGALLGLLNIVIFIYMASPWGVTTAFVFWGAWIYQLFGGHSETWSFFTLQPAMMQALKGGLLNHGGSIINIGLIVGAFLSAAAASQFKIKKIKSGRQVIAALIGGLLMGYGARLSFGCNVGAYFSGIASMSLHGWVFGIFIFVGAYFGSKLVVKYLM